MYSKVLAQCVVGDVLGRTGQDVVRAFFQMFVLGIGVMVAALAGIFISMDLVFPIALIYPVQSRYIFLSVPPAYRALH